MKSWTKGEVISLGRLVVAILVLIQFGPDIRSAIGSLLHSGGVSSSFVGSVALQIALFIALILASGHLWFLIFSAYIDSSVGTGLIENEHRKLLDNWYSRAAFGLASFCLVSLLLNFIMSSKLDPDLLQLSHTWLIAVLVTLPIQLLAYAVVLRLCK